MTAEPLVDDRTRRAIARVFRLTEDVVFVGLGALLAGCALYMLAESGYEFARLAVRAALTVAAVIDLVEQFLLILLVVELMYTVQVSFREHALAAEPFLLIGLIAAVRRVLVVTAELAEPQFQTADMFPKLMTELGVLTVMILALVAAVALVRRHPANRGEAGGRE